MIKLNPKISKFALNEHEICFNFVIKYIVIAGLIIDNEIRQSSNLRCPDMFAAESGQSRNIT